MDSEKFRQSYAASGALCIVAAGFMFAMMGALIKMAMAAGMSNETVVFSRNLFVFLPMIPYALVFRHRNSIKTQQFKFHLIRSLAGLASMYCYFFALSKIPLAEAVLLSYTAPLFIPLVAFLWLKEPIRKRFIAAVIVGFLGIASIMKPGSGVFQTAALAGLLAGALASVAMVSIRRMSSSEPPFRIVFYYTLISTLLSFIPLTWGWTAPDPATWGILAAAGFVAYIGQMLVTSGYSLAPSAQLGPFTYTTVVFAGAVGWLLWGESPDALSWTGAVLVFVAGIVAARK